MKSLPPFILHYQNLRSLYYWNRGTEYTFLSNVKSPRDNFIYQVAKDIKSVLDKYLCSLYLYLIKVSQVLQVLHILPIPLLNQSAASASNARQACLKWRKWFQYIVKVQLHQMHSVKVNKMKKKQWGIVKGHVFYVLQAHQKIG